MAGIVSETGVERATAPVLLASRAADGLVAGLVTGFADGLAEGLAGDFVVGVRAADEGDGD
jgi:hypothetical protein